MSTLPHPWRVHVRRPHRPRLKSNPTFFCSKPTRFAMEAPVLECNRWDATGEGTGYQAVNESNPDVQLLSASPKIRCTDHHSECIRRR